MGRGVYIEGVSEQTVSSAAAAHALWARGNRSRSVAATAMNRESSRSHSVFTLVVEATEKREAVTRSRVAQFNMVDLAGAMGAATSPLPSLPARTHELPRTPCQARSARS